MKKVILSLILTVSCFCVFSVNRAEAYNFGDFRSETLTTKAWGALEAGDLEAVLAFTGKNFELYTDQAKKMQNSLEEYPSGDNDKIFSFWALNDVAASLFIQGEAYRKAGKLKEAKKAYQRVVKEFGYGQVWDPANSAFWKPAAAAQEKLDMMASGSTIDFGDYTSSYLTSQAWNALNKSDIDSVVAYTDKVIELYQEEAKKMQSSLKEFPWGPNEEVFKYWALNDVGTSLFIRGEAYKKVGKNKEALSAYQNLVDDYSFSQCWDPKGWFWKPSEAAQQALDELGAS